MVSVANHAFDPFHWRLEHADGTVGTYTESVGPLGAFTTVGSEVVHNERLWIAASLTTKGSAVDLTQEPGTTDDWLLSGAASTQATDDTRRYTRSDTTNKIEWHLSALNYTGTAVDQLRSAITALAALTAPRQQKRLVVDMDIQLSSPLTINVPNLHLRAAAQKSTRIFADPAVAAEAMINFIVLTEEGITIDGFVIEPGDKVQRSFILSASNRTTVINNRITGEDAVVQYNRRKAANGNVGDGYIQQQGVRIQGGAAYCTINDNEIQHTNTGISLNSCGPYTTIERNQVDDYVNKGLFFIPVAGFDTNGWVRVHRNQFGLPANAYLADPDTDVAQANVSRQPVAFQRQAGTYTEGLSFKHNFFRGDGTPYVSENINDSPGANANELSRAAADSFSFHACRNFSIESNESFNGGELGFAISLDCQNGRVANNLAYNADTGGFYVGSSQASLSSSNISVVNNQAMFCSSDVNGDHALTAPFIITELNGGVVAGNSSFNDDQGAVAWDSATAYSVGDRVVAVHRSGGDFGLPNTNTYSGILSWTASPAGNFVPGYRFRQAGITVGSTAQQVYEVPAGFVGTKGATWDATEEARYTHIGNFGTLNSKSEFVIYECIEANTGDFPGWSAAQWTALNSLAPTCVLLSNSTNISCVDNSAAGAALPDRSVLYDMPNSTFSAINNVSTTTANRPVITGRDNSGYQIYDSDLSEYIVWRDNAWAQVGGGGATTGTPADVWEAFIIGSTGAVSEASNVTSATNTGTGIVEITLSKPLPVLNHHVSVTNRSSAPRTFYTTVTNGGSTVTVQSYNAAGGLVNANFTIRAIEFLENVSTVVASNSVEVNGGTVSASANIDFSAGNPVLPAVLKTLNQNAVFTFTDPPNGGANVTVRLLQDATGGRTVTWPASVVNAGALPAPTATANTSTVYQFYFDGTNYHW